MASATQAKAPTSSSSSSSSSSSAAQPSPQNDWRVALLQQIGAPVTKQNLAFLGAWQQAEGGHTNNAARFNYLNTTRGEQYPAINDVGVRAFPDYQTGIRLTAETIQSGLYPGIVAGLKRGDPLSRPLESTVIGDLSTWVSGQRTSNTDYGKKILFVAGSGGSFDVGSAVRGAVGNAASNLPGAGIVSGAVDAATAPARAIEWLWGNWDRAAIVAGGSVLVLVGLVLMGVRLGLTPGPGRLAKMGGRFAADRATSGGREATAIAGDSAGARASRQGTPRRVERVTPLDARPSPRRRTGYDPSSSDIPF